MTTAPRRRNTVLATFELFRKQTPDLWVNNILTFLYVCENEGASVSEIAQVSRLLEATASRCIRSFAAPGTPGVFKPALGLLELVEDPADGRGRLVYLTPKGRALAAQIDGLIRDAVTISGKGANPA